MVVAPLEINGCTAASFMDATGGLDQRTLIWGPASLFDPLKKCIKVKVGQTVRWAGDFTAHPLVQDEGTTPTPIAGKSGGGVGSYDVEFTAVGTFGYLCTEHGSMTGAIYVVP
jgi:plastocyanin